MNTTLRHCAAYVLLLVLTGAAEYALLRAGRGLVAAAVVRGEWQLRLPELRLPESARGCFATMSIAQSGPDVEITFPKAAKLTGTIDGRRLRASAGGRVGGNARCAAATVVSQLEGHALRGSLQFGDDAPIPFVATRSGGAP